MMVHGPLGSSIQTSDQAKKSKQYYYGGNGQIHIKRCLSPSYCIGKCFYVLSLLFYNDR
jgi:hypothetical protein